MWRSRENVGSGAALLDQKRPGWYREIDLDQLEMGSDTKCVLGQLYGEYIKGRYTLTLLGKTFVYGFNTTLEDYKSLQLMWEEEIRSRLQKGGK